jgi:hypothetical protein
MRDPKERLDPADVLRHALDAAHGNYRLATLTAHNFLKEIAYVGREEIDSINKANKPVDRNKWPAVWIGISPDLGNVARKLRGLRDSTVPDKMGAWYHFFVPLAGEAWGSVESAERMTAVEHAARRWGVFKNPDPEKREIDLIAMHVMKEIRAARVSPDGRGTAAANAPDSALIQGPRGKILVTVSDSLYPDKPLAFLTIKATTGKEPHKRIATFSSGEEYDLAAGDYTVEMADSIYEAREIKKAAVEAGRTTTVSLTIKNTYGLLDVSVIDGKTGRSFDGIDVAISGPQSYGPLPSPASFPVVAGGYRILIPATVIQGRHYRAKEASAEVVNGRRTTLAVRLDPYPPAPTPSTIRLNPGTLELSVGESQAVTAEVLDQDGTAIPGSPVTWTSSAPAVARADGGQISGLTRGKAEIAAVSGNAKASIVVRVVSTSFLNSCRIINKPRSLPAGGAVYALKGEAYDTDGGKIETGIRFAWESSDNTVASVDRDSGRILTRKPGKFTIFLTAEAGDGTKMSSLEDIEVENSWMEILVSGRVLQPDSAPAAGAQVQVANGPIVLTGGEGEFTTIVGGGPHPEGSTIEAESYLNGASGKAKGTVRDGVLRGLTIVLNKAGSGSGQPSASSLAATERQAIADQINEWQKALDCLLEGKKKYPNSWLNCNGNYTMRDRDVEIAHFQQLIRDARIKLGLPVSPVAVSSTREGPGASAEPATAGRQAAVGFLSFLHFYGNSIWITPPDGPEVRAAQSQPAPPGSALRTGKDSRVTVLINKTTTANIAESTEVRLPKPDEASGLRKSFEVRAGRVDFSRPEGPPSFDDIIVTTPHGSITPRGTVYRVEVDETGTSLAVFEGIVHASGGFIIREYGPSVESGKPSPVKELDVRAGERARLIGAMPGPGTGGHLPGWITGEETGPGREKGETAKPAKPVPAPAKPGAALPSWIKPPSESNPPSKPKPLEANLLNLPDPWNHPAVQALMDEWTRTAVPPSNTPGVVMKYNEWAQPLSQAARATSAPDHPADWTRYRYLWENRLRYGSTNLCTLGVFLEKRIKGESLDDCRKEVQPRGGPASTIPNDLPGALALIGRIKEVDWINGKPDLGGREILLLLFPEPASDEGLPQRAYICMQHAHNLAGKIKTSGKVFIVLAGGKSRGGRDAADTWKSIMDGYRFAFPVAIDRSGDALAAFQDADPMKKSPPTAFRGFVINKNGEIIRTGMCDALFSDLQASPKK